MSGNSNITFQEALNRLFSTFIFENINTCIPGIIERQDGPYRAVVVPAINRKYSDGTILKYKPIANVPIIYQRTAKAAIRLPKLQKGDTVLLIFTQKALDTWLSSDDGAQCQVDDPRRFDITDAICLPGLYPFKVDTPEPESLDNLEIIFNDSKILINPDNEIILDNGKGKIEILSDKVKINGDFLTVSNT